MRINSALKKMICTEKARQEICNIQQHSPDSSLQILQDLKNEFIHRHGFYWSSYYKLLLYHLFVISLPVIAYFYLSKIDPGSSVSQWFPTIILMIALIIPVLMHFLLKETQRYLNDEDSRLKLVIDKMRDVYYAKFGINLYPDKKTATDFAGNQININTATSVHQAKRPRCRLYDVYFQNHLSGFIMVCLRCISCSVLWRRHR